VSAAVGDVAITLELLDINYKSVDDLFLSTHDLLGSPFSLHFLSLDNPSPPQAELLNAFLSQSKLARSPAAVAHHRDQWRLSIQTGF